MRTVFFLSLAFPGLVSGLNTVLYGPAARELLLVTAKVAAREGLETSCICAPGTEDGCRRLMYGTEYIEEEGGDKPGYARPVSSGEDIQDSLQSADSLIFVAYDTPIDEKSYNTLLSSTGDNLSKVVLMSKMGVTKATGGFFGGGDAKLLESENLLRGICKTKGVDLSIVRAGTLKGGGAGEEGNDFGLNRCYYDTLLDVVEASVTMAHDKYTLGLDCQKGDGVEVPNMFTQMGSKSSFEACPHDTNRILVAGGVVAAALYDKPIEFSVSAEKATEPPTLEDWNEAFSTII
jgi:hypothetical protein